jgi:hypothetical protein
MPGRVAVAMARAATRAKTANPEAVAASATASAGARDRALGQVWHARLRASRVLRLTLALALVLLLVGSAGLEAAALLTAALRPPLPGDEASAVCDYLLAHDYDALASEMDPAPAGASTDPFEPAAFVAQLRALDAREGTVRTCALRQLGASGDGATVLYSLTLRRTRVPDPLGSLVVVHRRAGGGWVISRSSTFYDAPE